MTALEVIEAALAATEQKRWGDVPDRVAVAEWAAEVHDRLAAAGLLRPGNHHDITGEAAEHPPAFRVLHDTYRQMDCPAAVDPVDPDDCASVADASIRALMAAGLLLPAGTRSVEQFAARVTLDGQPVEAIPEATTRERAEARVKAHDRERAENPGWRGSAELVHRHQHTTPYTSVDSPSVNSVGGETP